MPGDFCFRFWEWANPSFGTLLIAYPRAIVYILSQAKKKFFFAILIKPITTLGSS